MVSLRRAQMRLPLFVFVNASACSNASCRMKNDRCLAFVNGLSFCYSPITRARNAPTSSHAARLSGSRSSDPWNT